MCVYVHPYPVGDCCGPQVAPCGGGITAGGGASPPALPLPLPLPFGVRAAGRASQATGAVRTAVSLSVEATPQGPAPSPLQRIVVTQQCSWTMTTDAYFPKEARYPHFYAVCSH